MNATLTRNEATILKAITATLAYTDAPWATLGAIRDESGLNRADFDQAMTALAYSLQVVLIPEENQKAITSADERNGLWLAGEVKHLVNLG